MADQMYMVTLKNIPSQRQSAEAIVYEPESGRASGKTSVVAIVPTNQGWSFGGRRPALWTSTIPQTCTGCTSASSTRRVPVRTPRTGKISRTRLCLPFWFQQEVKKNLGVLNMMCCLP